MKPLSQLTVQDLKQAQVWEYRGHSDREAWVRPTQLESLREYQDGVYLAATHFRLANGLECMGYCSPLDFSGLDYAQPVILLEGGPLRLWHEGKNTKRGLLQELESVGLSKGLVFPLKMECLVAVDNEYHKMTISEADCFG